MIQPTKTYKKSSKFLYFLHRRLSHAYLNVAQNKPETKIPDNPGLW